MIAAMPTYQLDPLATQLLIIDMQEKFVPSIPAIAGDQSCGRAVHILTESCRHLELPMVISEQYPQGLGGTLPWITALCPNAVKADKTHFSCCDDAAMMALIHRQARRTIIVCGIEAHVCVLATVTDLLARGYDVVVAGDAVASRKVEHRDLAIAAMRELGALVIPVESIVFRLLRQSGTPQFKYISKLVR